MQTAPTAVDARREMIAVLLSTTTAATAKRQLLDGPDRVHVSAFGMDFRLLKTAAGTSNLEFLVVGSVHRYFQPIGFYSTSGDVTVLREFEEAAASPVRDASITLRRDYRVMSTLENALIAAFSARVLEKAESYEDVRLISNGMITELWMSNRGYPQVFVDDRYRVEGPIGGYMLHGPQATVGPVRDYEQLCGSLDNSHLLTAFSVMRREISQGM